MRKVLTGRKPQLQQKKRTVAVQQVFDWVQAIIAAVVIALFIRTFLFTLVRVDGLLWSPRFKITIY